MNWRAGFQDTYAIFFIVPIVIVIGPQHIFCWAEQFKLYSIIVTNICVSYQVH